MDPCPAPISPSRLCTKRERLGEVLFSPADLEIEHGNITQPDLFVMPIRPTMWSDVKSLLLAVEVLSPSTDRYDRVTTRGYYLRNGTPEYWMVDVAGQVVERWRADSPSRPEVVSGALSWQPAGAKSPLEIDLYRFFADTSGDG